MKTQNIYLASKWVRVLLPCLFCLCTASLNAESGDININGEKLKAINAFNILDETGK